MKSIVLLALTSGIVLASCTENTENSGSEILVPVNSNQIEEEEPDIIESELSEVPTYVDSVYAFLILQNEIEGFGYELYEKDKLIIRQPHIPAVSGRSGFKTVADAEKVAVFAISKLQNNIFPPTISVEELESLGVLAD